MTKAPLVTILDDEPAIRAYERAGFQWARVWEDPISGPSWMMLRHRPAM